MLIMIYFRKMQNRSIFTHCSVYLKKISFLTCSSVDPDREKKEERVKVKVKEKLKVK